MQRSPSPLFALAALGAFVHGCSGAAPMRHDTELTPRDAATMSTAALTQQDAAVASRDDAALQGSEVGRPDDAAEAAASNDAPASADAGLAVMTETGWIVYMREQEKLARDVYGALNDHSTLFADIAASEQRHMNALAALITRYRLTDTVSRLAQGRFSTPAFQQLYDRRVAQGKTSTIAALQVGAAIEDLDIADLNEAVFSARDPEVKAVFQQLVKDSRNHLRSLVAQLSQRGASYTPQFIDAHTYRSIVTSPAEGGPDA